MNETQTLEAIDEAIAAVQNLQKHSMVATAEPTFVAAENLILLRKQFAKTYAARFRKHRVI